MSEPSGTRLARATLARLREKIASEEWPVGSRIPTEPELSRLLGVGRSTIREAIRSLAALGMVETKRAHGTYVLAATPAPELLMNALSAYAPEELIGLRRALDVEAAQIAAVKWTDAGLAAVETALHEETECARMGAGGASAGGGSCSQFHSAIAQAAGNRLLADLNASLTRALAASGLAERIASAQDEALQLGEHDRIFTAIRARDPAIAAHQMAMHVDSTLRGLHYEPVVTDLTALGGLVDVARPRRRQARARIA